MSIHLLSSRHLEASPQMTILYDLENILIETCNAELILPQPRPIKQWDLQQQSSVSDIANRILRKTIGEYYPLKTYSTVQHSLKTQQSEPRVLMILALNGNGLELLKALPNWRQDFDVVIAYVLDCWMLETLPPEAQQVDHLFIPYPALQELVQSHLQRPISVLPLGFDVLHQGRGRGDRSIDVSSYGRTPWQYHQQLLQTAARPSSETFYYRQIPERGKLLPACPYGPLRNDYQHRLQLNQVLRHSKIVLAFENLYTTSITQQPGSHITHRLRDSITTTRWFEGTGCGCVVVGKRPQSKLMDQYLNWPNSTLELPDSPEAGLDFIQDLLQQAEYLQEISQQNYLNSLRLNDWRLRLQAMFEQVSLPTPTGLEASLEQLQHSYTKQIEAVPIPY